MEYMLFVGVGIVAIPLFLIALLIRYWPGKEDRKERRNTAAG